MHFHYCLFSEPHRDAPFTISELTSALHSCHNTYKGPEHIYYLLLKHLPPSSLAFLLTLCYRVWMKGDLSPSWCEALTLSFVKPSKSGSPNQLPSEDPIALTSCLCKLLEMVTFKLMWHLESKSLLSPCQFGFECARSTADPQAHIHTYILNLLLSAESVPVVFFGLGKAYGSTWG